MHMFLILLPCINTVDSDRQGKPHQRQRNRDDNQADNRVNDRNLRGVPRLRIVSRRDPNHTLNDYNKSADTGSNIQEQVVKLFKDVADFFLRLRQRLVA